MDPVVDWIHHLEDTMARTLGYVRVSTEEQATAGVSLDAQRAKVRAYCDLHDLTLVDVVADEGVSGKRADNRPGLQEALRRLRNGEADALVVLKLDRLSRSVRDTLDLVEKCGREGWALHSISEKLDTGSAAGRFVVTVLAALAQMEREQIGERTRSAMAHMKAQGRLVGAVPFGFDLDADGTSLVPVAEEQAVISEVLEMAQTMSQRGVAAALNARGIKTKRGKGWTNVQIGNILREHS
jgi:site-specific DNA recombinase